MLLFRMEIIPTCCKIIWSTSCDREFVNLILRVFMYAVIAKHHFSVFVISILEHFKGFSSDLVSFD